MAGSERGLNVADAILMQGGSGGITSDDVTASKAQVLQGYKTVTTDSDDEMVEGTIAIRGYKGPDSPEMWHSQAEGGYVVRFLEGYYHKVGIFNPYVIAPTALVKAAVGYNPGKTLNDTVTCGEQGLIPMWSPEASGIDDVLYAWNNEGMVFDLRNNGRGILVRIPDGHYINRANWVFLRSPNLQPWNVRAGMNINGCVGTLVDYGAGGTVFNGATFDNKFCSGVANSVFKGVQCRNITVFQGSLQRNAAGGTKRGIFHGIADGGLKIQIYASTKNLPAFPYVGCALNNSINLTPFSKIRVGYFFRDVDYRVAEYNGNVSASVAVTVVPTTNYSDTSTEGFRVRGYASNAAYNRKLHNATFSSGFNQSDFVQQYVDLDVSTLQGHHFVMIGADSDVSHNTCYISAAFVINHIELIN